MNGLRRGFLALGLLVGGALAMYTAIGGFSAQAQGRSGTWPVSVEYQVGSFTIEGEPYAQTWLFEGSSWSDWTVTLLDVEGRPDDGLRPGYTKQLDPEGYEVEGGMEEFEGLRVPVGAGQPSAPDGLLNPRSSHPDAGAVSADTFRGGAALRGAGLGAVHDRLDIAVDDVAGLVSTSNLPCGDSTDAACVGGAVAYELRSVTHTPTGLPLFVERRAGGHVTEWLQVVELRFAGGD